MVIDDSTRLPLANALLVLLDERGSELGRAVRTNGDGTYILHHGTPGTYRIRAMYLGYQPVTSAATRLKAGEVATVNFSLTIAAQRIGSVVVMGRRLFSRDELMSLTGYELRRSKGLGVFLDSTHLRQFKTLPITGTLQDHSTVPQVFVREVGNSQVLEMASGSGRCEPQLFIDGWSVKQWRFFSLPSDEIFALELYGRGTLPPASLGGEIGDYGGRSFAQKCGAIAAWTKAYEAAKKKKGL